MRFALTALVLLANAWALVSVLGSSARASARLGWVLAIILVPIVGAAAWLAMGPRTTKTPASA